MSNTGRASANGTVPVIETIKTRWLNYRRKRFWVLVAALLYTLLGFFAAPFIIKNTAVDFFRDDLGRFAQIGKVEVNPYVMSVRVLDFELHDKDDTRLVSFDEAFVNFQLSSLFNWAWTFGEIRVNAPYFYFERLAAGDTRLDHLRADFASSQVVESADAGSKEEAGKPVRLLIHNLGIQAGRVDVRDEVPEKVVETRLAPINISIQDLSTLPGRHGEQTVTIWLPNEARLQWSGSLSLAPLDSVGELVLEGLRLDPLIAYLKPILPLENMSMKLSSAFHYHVRLDDAGDLDVAIDQWEIDLDDLLLRGLTPVTDFVDIKKITLLNGAFRYPEQSLRFDSLIVENPAIAAWIKEDGELSIMDLKPDADAGQADVNPEPGSPPWQFNVDEFGILDGSLAFSDLSITPVAELGITELTLGITEISNQDDALMPFNLAGNLSEGGSYQLSGSVSVLPRLTMTASASTKNIPLSLGQPYVQQFAHIVVEAGEIDSEIKINLPDSGDISLGGSLHIPGLVLNDVSRNQRLLAWDSLDIDQFDLTGEGLHLSLMTFEKTFARFVIHEDKTTNLSTLLIEQAKGETSDPMNIIIGGIRVNESSMNFADLSLPLSFSTHIAHLNGTVSTIATNSSAPANIKLEGQVDEFGLARIEGSMNMFDPIQHTDILVDFRNLKMSNLSPYTVQFAGREIDEGKLNLGLVYAIDEGQLLGGNDVVLNDLVLGDKVDHPDASSLPLGLAVGLLKDANGVIKIDLPVEGDINDPEFRIGSVIWQALSGMISKIVTAPFRLLGKLIGVDSEDLGQFEFLAGRSDLTPPELEKVEQLKEALAQRPELVVEISGVTNPAIDVPALKSIRLRQIVEQHLEKDLGDGAGEAMMLDVETRAVVEALFVERFPETPPDSLKAGFTAPPASDPEAKPVLDEWAYATDLWKRLLASEVISGQDITELADARAGILRAAFLGSGEFDQSRVVTGDNEEVESEDGEWVMLKLSIASD